MLLAIIVVLPDTSELTDEEGDDNEVNTSVIIVKDVSGSSEVRSGDSFQPSQVLVSRQQRVEKKLKDTSHIMDKE
ncbi:hypothetical protein TNCV_2596501 [Trichonephila clavipes]|nr:hypothetical protein TNCV_2596501 [Trichonephila clavipes]